MKALTFLFLILPFNISAGTKCSEYELKGEVHRKGPDIILITAPKSLSEKTYRFDLPTRPAILPYIDNFVSGVFTLQGEDKIIKASLIKDAVFDPVGGEKIPSVKKLKDVTCPQ